MIKNKRLSLACKMALSAMCTALCVEGMLLRGLYVPAHAEDEDSGEELKSEIISWLNTSTKELDIFGVSAFGSREAALSNPTFAGVWAGYKTAKWCLENPSLSAGYDNNITYLADLHPTVGFYADNNGTVQSVMIYDYTHFTVSDYSVRDIPLASSGQFQIRASVYNTDEVNTNPHFATVQTISGSSDITSRCEAGTSLVGECNCKFTVGGYFDKPEYNYRYTGQTSNYPICGASIRTSSSLPSVLSSSVPYTNSIYHTMIVGGGGLSLSMSNLPEIGLKQAFDPATASKWINSEFYPYVASQTDEGQPLEGFEPTPPPGATPEPPDVGTLDSLNFPPGLPSTAFNDVQLPSESLPKKMLSGASFWFTSFSNMLDALGVKYIVITFLIIALIMAILKI